MAVHAMNWQCPAKGLAANASGAAVRVCKLLQRECAPRSEVLAGLPALHFLDGADLRQPPAAPPPFSPPAPAPATAKRRAAGGKAAALAAADAPAAPRDLGEGAWARGCRQSTAGRVGRGWS